MISFFSLIRIQQKYAIIFVLQFKKISLWPDPSGPPRFRIQGGWHLNSKHKKKNYDKNVYKLILKISALDLLGGSWDLLVGLGVKDSFTSFNFCFLSLPLQI